MAEQRAHPRFPLEIAVDLQSEHNFYSGMSGDISEGGIFIATYTLPGIGECVEMGLTLPQSGATFTLKGVVRWIRDLSADGDGTPPGFGLAWTEISSSALEAIRRFAIERDSLFFEAA